MPFQTLATRSGIPAKIMIGGISGGGKTYTALRIATGIVEGTGRPIGVGDTQNGQSRRYANDFRFMIEYVRNHDPLSFVKLIEDAERAQLGALVIDTATHEWAACLAMIDQIASNGSSNNAWRVVTPKHKKFIEAIVQATIPIIVTVRTKTEWMYVEEQRQGRKIIVPHRVGMKPEQRDQFEYEFDLYISVNREHTAYVEKSVFPFLETGTDAGILTEQTGTDIRDWFSGTDFDPEAELQARARDDRAMSRETPRRPSVRSQAPEDADMPADLGAGTDTMDDGDPAPADQDDEEEDDEDDGDMTDEGAAEAEEQRTELISRYRTMVAIAVMSKHADGLKLAGKKLDEMTDAEIQGTITTLERIYPTNRPTGSYQCGTCGRKIYPHVIEEYAGSSFPGLQLLAISIRDYKKPLCPQHLAVERRKAKRRGPNA